MTKPRPLMGAGLFFAPDDADYLRNLAAGRRSAGYNGSADKLDAIAAAIEAAQTIPEESNANG